MHYVYLLVSTSKEKYIGNTANLEKRLNQHNAGENASTGGQQWTLAYFEAYLSKEDALERERKLKHDGRARRFVYERARRSLA